MKQSSIIRAVSKIVTRAVSSCLPAEVILDGFKASSKKIDEADRLGENGIIIRATVEGWGVAFESRTIVTNFVIDTRFDTQSLTESILLQADSMIRFQTSQRLRALALGIPAPLQRDDFLNLQRLRIDIAAASALRQMHSSDLALTNWLKEQLGYLWDSYRSADRGSVRAPFALRVHRLAVAVPFLLNPVRIAENAIPFPDQPVWTDNEIRLVRPDKVSDACMCSMALELINESPLRGRAMTAHTSWPPTGLVRAAETHGGGGSHNFSIEVKPTWSAVVEPRYVSVVEAFD